LTLFSGCREEIFQGFGPKCGVSKHSDILPLLEGFG
jgi:hypothetical protein